MMPRIVVKETKMPLLKWLLKIDWFFRLGQLALIVVFLIIFVLAFVYGD